MTRHQSFSWSTILLVSFILFTSCSPKAFTPEIVLVGSSPGDDLIKSMLSIPADTKIDFMRWNLRLGNEDAFVLNLTFGESQPNTLGFKSGSGNLTVKGIFRRSESPDDSSFREIYHLESKSLPDKISLVKLNENLFHLLTPQNQLMIGNGGWSYSLNRKNPVRSDDILFSSRALDDQLLQFVFEGRTPCQEIAAEHAEMNAGPSCFKLKWQLILNRDSVTLQPTTCSIRNVVNNEPRNTSGNWEIINGTEEHPDVLIYRIHVDNLTDPIWLLAGDENVLFFLDKNKEPMIGNEDFSFTMNRRIQTTPEY